MIADCLTRPERPDLGPAYGAPLERPISMNVWGHSPVSIRAGNFKASDNHCRHESQGLYSHCQIDRRGRPNDHSLLARQSSSSGAPYLSVNGIAGKSSPFGTLAPGM